jgi:hypothetical protein
MRSRNARKYLLQKGKKVPQTGAESADQGAFCGGPASASLTDYRQRCKKAKADYCVVDPLKNGGSSNDRFKKSLGRRKMAELFRKILFRPKYVKPEAAAPPFFSVLHCLCDRGIIKYTSESRGKNNENF